MKQNFPVYFPIFFVSMWLLVTTLLGFMSGWFSLMSRYPDRNEAPLLRLRGQSGSMGPLSVNMSGILTLSACPSGLRVSMFRLFGVFSRSFFVPWDEISVRRKTRLFFRLAELQFGNPLTGKLSIASHVADRLARAASQDWPEEGSFPRETVGQAFSSVLKQWFAMTTFAALFFTFGPMIMSGGNARGVPIEIAIGFPADRKSVV